MVGEYVLSITHNSSLTPKFATSFCPSYVTAQEASVTPKVFATRQEIQTDGLASSSSPITRAREARIVMPQSFRPLNIEEERTLLAKGEETITPQAVTASNSHVSEYMYIRKTHNFPLISLWNVNFKCVKWRKACEYTIV
jgi:hypothetical protein